MFQYYSTGTSRPRIAVEKVSPKNIGDFLASEIKKEVRRRFLTHKQVSEEIGIARTVVTAVLNGRLEKISTDRLLRVADGLGLEMELKIESK